MPVFQSFLLAHSLTKERPWALSKRYTTGISTSTARIQRIVWKLKGPMALPTDWATKVEPQITVAIRSISMDWIFFFFII